MRKTLLAGIALAALTISGCAATEEAPEVVEETVVEEEPTVTVPEAEAEGLGDIVEVAVANGSFETLAAALTAAGLVETLQGDGPFTVFAPTDEAFAALPEGLLEALLLEENRYLLIMTLRYHVMEGKVMAADLTTGVFPTLDGVGLLIDTSEGVVLNAPSGSATVITADVEASNGVIHVIDAVFLGTDDVTGLTRALVGN